MKILFINKEDVVGGTAQAAWNLALEMKRLGHEVRFIVKRKTSGDNDVYQLSDNFILRLLTKFFRRDFTIVLCNLRGMILSNDVDFGADEEVLNHPWVDWADVVHFHNLHGNYFKLINIVDISRRKPVVWTMHDLWSVTGRCAFLFGCEGYKRGCGECSRLSNYQNMLWDNSKSMLKKKKIIYKQSELTMVVPSLWMKKMACKSILKASDIRLIYNGINVDVFRYRPDKDKFRKKLGIHSNKKVALFFAYGWKNRDKGWGYIEKCANEFPEVEFVGIGAPVYLQEKNITFVKPTYDLKTISMYYNAADLFLAPSLAESFGLVATQSVLSGVPLVTFEVGVIPELVIHKKTGYIAKYGDMDDFVNGMRYILNNRMEAVNRNKVKEFSITTMAKNYIKLYEEKISKS